MQNIEILDIALPNPRGHAPTRRAPSVRRTSSLDVTWPDGPGKNAHFYGYARDIFTPADGAGPELITSDELFAEISSDRTIRHIRSAPARENIGHLVGVRGGGYLRGVLNDILPAEQRKGSPLYLLIDDLSGASLVCNWALYANGKIQLPAMDDAQRRTLAAQREGVCIGFRPGSSALDIHREIGVRRNTARVVPLHHPDDPAGWHPLTDDNGLSFRRARRIDVWMDEGIRIDATFQDSAAMLDGVREAVHEYSLSVTADPQSLTIRTIVATPHVLPFPECPNAIEDVAKLVGRPLGDMRSAVLETFPKVLGCTHLNDCMRSIAEVPVLVEELRART